MAFSLHSLSNTPVGLAVRGIGIATGVGLTSAFTTASFMDPGFSNIEAGGAALVSSIILAFKTTNLQQDVNNRNFTPVVS